MSQGGSLRKRGTTWTAMWFTPCPGGRVHMVRDEATGERVPCPKPGHRWQRSQGGFATKAAARAHLTTVLGQVQTGTYRDRDRAKERLTVREYLVEHWLPAGCPPNKRPLRPSTVASYRTAVEAWIVPHIGGRLLSELTEGVVDRELLQPLREHGARGKPVSERSVQYAFVVLNKALTHAAKSKNGYLRGNPLADMDRPDAPRAKRHSWTAEQAAAFLDHVTDDRLYAAWFLFLARGPRRGEVAGLKWEHVNLDEDRSYIRIVETRIMVDGKAIDSDPKTAAGRRQIPLDAEVSAALRAHRRRQLEERMKAGPAWQDAGYVFTMEDGAPLNPEHFSTAFERHAKAAGLPPIPLHGTRHTAATLALRAGVPTEAVSRWLGHSSVSITQDIYQDEVPQLMEQAGSVVTSLLSSHRKSTEAR